MPKRPMSAELADLKHEVKSLRRKLKMLVDLQIRQNELEGLGRMIEGELEMLREMFKDSDDDEGGDKWKQP